MKCIYCGKFATHFYYPNIDKETKELVCDVHVERTENHGFVVWEIDEMQLRLSNFGWRE